MVGYITLAAFSMLASLARAHFEILHPPSHIGIDEGGGSQTEGPCSGFTPAEDEEAADFYVGGDAIAVADTHAQSDWLIRGFLGAELADGEWEQLSPIYQRRGAGRSCNPSVSAPDEWAGQRGIIAMVASASDGYLYACAAVRFIEGTGPEREECVNGTSNSLRWVENAEMEALLESEPPGSTSGSGSGGDDHSEGGHSEEEEAGDEEGGAARLCGGMSGAFAVMLVTLIRALHAL